MRLYKRLWIVGTVSIILLILLLLVFALRTEFKEKNSTIESLRLKNTKLNSKLIELKSKLGVASFLLSKKTTALTQCVKDQMGEKSGFIPLYESVETAQKMELIIYSEDTESGEPRRFLLDCGGNKP